jgi:catechol 2,3-dioxygenase-like lactoylglutathione lyase family enzyme
VFLFCSYKQEMRMELRRGRLFDHVHLVVDNIWAARKFYSAVLEVMEIPIRSEGTGWFTADELYVSTGKKTSGGVHLALCAGSRVKVEQFYRAGLSSGGTDNGGPGERPYHPGYYAAYVLDPDGNNVEAVHHGPVTRSADSVVVHFSA